MAFLGALLLSVLFTESMCVRMKPRLDHTNPDRARMLNFSNPVEYPALPSGRRYRPIQETGLPSIAEGFMKMAKEKYHINQLMDARGTSESQQKITSLADSHAVNMDAIVDKAVELVDGAYPATANNILDLLLDDRWVQLKVLLEMMKIASTNCVEAENRVVNRTMKNAWSRSQAEAAQKAKVVIEEAFLHLSTAVKNMRDDVVCPKLKENAKTHLVDLQEAVKKWEDTAVEHLPEGSKKVSWYAMQDMMMIGNVGENNNGEDALSVLLSKAIEKLFSKSVENLIPDPEFCFEGSSVPREAEVMMFGQAQAVNARSYRIVSQAQDDLISDTKMIESRMDAALGRLQTLTDECAGETSSTEYLETIKENFGCDTVGPQNSDVCKVLRCNPFFYMDQATARAFSAVSKVMNWFSIVWWVKLLIKKIIGSDFLRALEKLRGLKHLMETFVDMADFDDFYQVLIGSTIQFLDAKNTVTVRAKCIELAKKLKPFEFEDTDWSPDINEW